MFFNTSENENPELYKNGGRSAMLQTFPHGGRSAMLQIFRGRSAMLQIFRGKVGCRPSGGRSARGKVCNTTPGLTPGVILQTFPPEYLQWYWKTIADLPPLQIFPRYHFNRYRFYLYIFILIAAILWKIPVIYINEYNSFIIERQILHVQSFIMIKNPFFYISENESPELYKNGGRSAILQIFPRGRSAMIGGRSAMLQTFPLGGKSAMLQIFRGKFAMLQIFRGKICKGEGLQYNAGIPSPRLGPLIARR